MAFRGEDCSWSIRTASATRSATAARPDAIRAAASVSRGGSRSLRITGAWAAALVSIRAAWEGLTSPPSKAAASRRAWSKRDLPPAGTAME